MGGSDEQMGLYSDLYLLLELLGSCCTVTEGVGARAHAQKTTVLLGSLELDRLV